MVTLVVRRENTAAHCPICALYTQTVRETWKEEAWGGVEYVWMRLPSHHIRWR